MQRILFCATAQIGIRPPYCRGFEITHRHATFGRTPMKEWSALRSDVYLTTRKTQKRHTFTPPAGFEPRIPACGRPHTQTYASDRAATGTGSVNMLENKWVLYWQKQHDSCNTQFTLHSPTFREQRMNWRQFIHTYLPLTVTFEINIRQPVRRVQVVTWHHDLSSVISSYFDGKYDYLIDVSKSRLSGVSQAARVNQSLPKHLPWRQCHWPFDLDAIQMTTARNFNTVANCYETQIAGKAKHSRYFYVHYKRYFKQF